MRIAVQESALCLERTERLQDARVLGAQRPLGQSGSPASSVRSPSCDRSPDAPFFPNKYVYGTIWVMLVANS
jgi:hypothetical protein